MENVYDEYIANLLNREKAMSIQVFKRNRLLSGGEGFAYQASHIMTFPQAPFEPMKYKIPAHKKKQRQ